MTPDLYRPHNNNTEGRLPASLVKRAKHTFVRAFISLQRSRRVSETNLQETQNTLLQVGRQEPSFRVGARASSHVRSVTRARDRQIKEVIRQGVEVPEGQNDLRRMQLRELAQLNGTLREHDAPRCANCTATDHKTWLVSL